MQVSLTMQQLFALEQLRSLFRSSSISSVIIYQPKNGFMTTPFVRVEFTSSHGDRAFDIDSEGNSERVEADESEISRQHFVRA